MTSARADLSTASSSHPDPAPDTVRGKARHPNTSDCTRPALPFPTHNVDSFSPTHARAKSTSTAGPTPQVRTRRARAASSATIGASEMRPRPRLPSMLASVLTQHKAPAQPRTAAHDPELVGSFTPTSSPRPRLRSLLSEVGTSPSPPGASESPQPTPPPSHFGTEPRVRARHQSDVRRRHPRTSPSVFHFHPLSHTAGSGAGAEPAIDAPPSPDLPSICRTPSSYSGSDYFPTAPSSAGPATPVHTAAMLPSIAGARKVESLHPVLENLERTSMFRVQTACATCGKHGSNFPCCPKCGEMWCSRVCRLQKGDGKRHICSKKSA